MVAWGRRYGGGTDAERGGSLLKSFGYVRQKQPGLGDVGAVVLYRLVASATLPPANQVRDKHKDD